MARRRRLPITHDCGLGQKSYAKASFAVCEIASLEV